MVARRAQRDGFCGCVSLNAVYRLPGSIRPNVAQLIAMTNGVKINFKFVAQVFRFGPLPQEPVDLTEAHNIDLVLLKPQKF